MDKKILKEKRQKIQNDNKLKKEKITSDNKRKITVDGNKDSKETNIDELPDDNDAAYYKDEIGEEPDEGNFATRNLVYFRN